MPRRSRQRACQETVGRVCKWPLATPDPGRPVSRGGGAERLAMSVSEAFALRAATVPSPRFTFAFQPIIDAVDRRVHSYEALVRGLSGESAAAVLQRAG